MSAATVRRRTLLGVWAHPDDEAYLSAGLMLEHVARGDRVVVVTATFGDHGTADPAAWPPPLLATRRGRELRHSLAVLGVHESHVLGFEDGTCAAHDGTAAVARIVDAVRPDVIVTFGPEGLTGHPDHRAVSRWATDARAATAPDADLWYTTVTPGFHDRWDHVNERARFFYDGTDRPSTPSDELCHSVALADGRLDAKVAALRAHRTQTAALEARLGARTYRQWWATETFRSAA
jgi:LmbE family N-acetylglucosaminyl deacetylase